MIKTVAHDKITTTASPIVSTRIIVASVHPPVFPLSRVLISGANPKEITRVFGERHLIASGPRFAQAYAPMCARRSNEDAYGTHCAVFPSTDPNSTERFTRVSIFTSCTTRTADLAVVIRILLP